MSQSQGKLWVDNDALNYLCKAGCLEQILQTAPYEFWTTEFVEMEAEKGLRQVPALQSGLNAMRDDLTIRVLSFNQPPLICNCYRALPNKRL